MAKTMKRPPAATPARSQVKGRFAPDPRREQVFELYRDLGPGRSFRKLAEAVSVRWPANPLSLGALSGWSTKFGWAKRIEEYELGLNQGQQRSQTTPQAVATEGDDISNLEKAASQALTRVLAGMSVAVTKAGDVKALVDTASKALELADKLKSERQGTATSEEIATFGAKLLGRIEEARRRDIVTMVKAAVEAACAEAGTTNLLPVLKKAAAAVGLRVNDEGEIDAAGGLGGSDGPGDSGAGGLGRGDLVAVEGAELGASDALPDYSDEVTPAQIEALNNVVPDKEFAEYKDIDSNSEVEQGGLDLEDVMRQLRGE